MILIRDLKKGYHVCVFMEYLILYQDIICIIKIGDDVLAFIVFVLDMLLKKKKKKSNNSLFLWCIWYWAHICIGLTSYQTHYFLNQSNDKLKYSWVWRVVRPVIFRLNQILGLYSFNSRERKYWAPCLDYKSNIFYFDELEIFCWSSNSFFW